MSQDRGLTRLRGFRLRPLIMKSLVVAGATLMTLLLVEAALRVHYKLKGLDINTLKPAAALDPLLTDRQGFFVSHPFMPFAQRPGGRGAGQYYWPKAKRTYAYQYSLDSRGFRTPERPFEKPGGVKRIVTLGGSTTFQGSTDSETWPARLEARLNELYAPKGIAVEVINLSVTAGASPTSLINLEFVGLDFRPDLVISYDGVNDAALIGFEGVAPDYRNAYSNFDDRYRSWQSRLPGWAFRSYLVTRLSFALDRAAGGSDLFSRIMIVNELKPSGDVLAGMHLFERNLKLQQTLSHGSGARYLAATPHWLAPDKKLSAMNDELRRFFAREGIDYVDLDALLPHDDWSLHVDAAHWTPEGIERVAGEMQNKIVAGNLLGLE